MPVKFEISLGNNSVPFDRCQAVSCVLNLTTQNDKFRACGSGNSVYHWVTGTWLESSTFSLRSKSNIMPPRHDTDYIPLSPEPKPAHVSLNDDEAIYDTRYRKQSSLRMSKRKRALRLVTYLSLGMNVIFALYLISFEYTRSSYVVWRGVRPLYSKFNSICVFTVLPVFIS